MIRQLVQYRAALITVRCIGEAHPGTRPPIADREHLVSLTFQEQPDELGVLRVVVGYQDARGHAEVLA